MLKALGSLVFFGLAAALLRKCAAEFRAMANDSSDQPGDGLGFALRIWLAFWFAFLGFGLLVEVSLHG